jgi:hypothetical protein
VFHQTPVNVGPGFRPGAADSVSPQAYCQGSPGLAPGGPES